MTGFRVVCFGEDQKAKKKKKRRKTRQEAKMMLRTLQMSQRPMSDSSTVHYAAQITTHVRYIEATS